jgi:flagellar secretion chaperone FliS
MFTQPAFRTAPHPAASLYRHVGVETGVGAASPHHLVGMLFDGLAESLVHAKAAIASRDLPRKAAAIGRAAAIVNEGLRGSLDLAGGGELARNLHELYAYVVVRLTQANAANDEAAIDECQRLIQPLHDAWRSITPGVDR